MRPPPTISRQAPRRGHAYSLRRRYLALAALLTLTILMGTSAMQLYVDRVTAQNSRHIAERSEAARRINRINHGLQQLQQLMTEFLIAPRKNNTDRWRTQMAQLRDEISHLRRLEWTRRAKIEGTLDRLLDLVAVVEREGFELIEVRASAIRQFPALYYARDTMFPLARQFIQRIGEALEELEEDSSAQSHDWRRRLVEIRYHWLQIINQFRLYVINRLGSFSVEDLPADAQDIEARLALVDRLLTELDREVRTHDTDLFLLPGILPELKKTALLWLGELEKVREINEGEDWRRDLTLLRDRLYPSLAETTRLLSSLQEQVERSYDQDVSVLTKTSQRATQLLWALSITGILIIAFAYVYFSRALLKPLASIAQALKQEAMGHPRPDLPRVSLLETADLVKAFEELRHQIRARQRALEHQALHDDLTGLPNRLLLNDRLRQALIDAARNSGSLALMILDLNRFKEINDTLGHQVGDQVLREVATKLRRAVRETDTVARMGGDEFAILLPRCDRHGAARLAKKILSSLEKVIHIQHHDLFVGGSIGIALYPEHGRRPPALVQYADVAMYLAKGENRGFAIYSPDRDSHSVGRLALAARLVEAIENDRLTLHYQPFLRLPDGRVAGAEALLRWPEQSGENISPQEIVSLAEHTGLINRLTQWVVDRALADCARCRLPEELSVAINLSMLNLQDRGLAGYIGERLAFHGVSAGRLSLEITETAMMSNPGRAMKVLSRLTDMGLSIAVDDYGTGFSSLAYLKQLPIHKLKIDKSFIFDMLENSDDRLIVRSVIDLAHNLGLQVVAEGVENEAMLESLARFGCDLAQGYHIAPPMDAKTLYDWVTSRDHTPFAGKAGGGLAGQ